MTVEDIVKGKVVYFVRVLPDEVQVCELTVRTVTDEYFVGTEKKDKQAFLLSYKNLDKAVFLDRKDAVKSAKMIELNRKRRGY